MKESFYFKHDYNARSDERILRLRRNYPDGSGYGIFWMLVEKLAESSEARLKLSNIEDIAFDMQIPCDRIADVINKYDLFKIEGDYFWSPRLISDLQERDEKSKKAKLAAKTRWDKEAKLMQTHSKRNTDAMQGEERRGEERKEKKGEEQKKTAAEKILRILKLPQTFPVKMIEDLILKYSEVDLEAIALKVSGKYSGKSGGDLWAVFVNWCATEKPAEPQTKGIIF